MASNDNGSADFKDQPGATHRAQAQVPAAAQAQAQPQQHQPLLQALPPAQGQGQGQGQQQTVLQGPVTHQLALPAPTTQTPALQATSQAPPQGEDAGQVDKEIGEGEQDDLARNREDGAPRRRWLKAAEMNAQQKAERNKRTREQRRRNDEMARKYRELQRQLQQPQQQQYGHTQRGQGQRTDQRGAIKKTGGQGGASGGYEGPSQSSGYGSWRGRRSERGGRGDRRRGARAGYQQGSGLSELTCNVCGAGDEGQLRIVTEENVAGWPRWCFYCGKARTAAPESTVSTPAPNYPPRHPLARPAQGVPAATAVTPTTTTPADPALLGAQPPTQHTASGPSSGITSLLQQDIQEQTQHIIADLQYQRDLDAAQRYQEMLQGYRQRQQQYMAATPQFNTPSGYGQGNAYMPYNHNAVPSGSLPQQQVPPPPQQHHLEAAHQTASSTGASTQQSAVNTQASASSSLARSQAEGVDTAAHGSAMGIETSAPIGREILQGSAEDMGRLGQQNQGLNQSVVQGLQTVDQNVVHGVQENRVERALRAQHNGYSNVLAHRANIHRDPVEHVEFHNAAGRMIQEVQEHVDSGLQNGMAAINQNRQLDIDTVLNQHRSFFYSYLRQLDTALAQLYYDNLRDQTVINALTEFRRLYTEGNLPTPPVEWVHQEAFYFPGRLIGEVNAALPAPVRHS